MAPPRVNRRYTYMGATSIPLQRVLAVVHVPAAPAVDGHEEGPLHVARRLRRRPPARLLEEERRSTVRSAPSWFTIAPSGCAPRGGAESRR
jgi:hypothetical protein